MLGARSWGVEKFVESAFDVSRHGDVDCALVVVAPVECETTVERAGPVDGDGVFISEGLDQMFGIFLPTYLIPKPSTTRQKEIGRVSCLKRPWVWVH